ncbi:MAG: HU family DNA-binding protein [Lachnospiraceae bacterium]|nr:HU family DNA-binding protein [Lachnospiraceae bacterium]
MTKKELSKVVAKENGISSELALKVVQTVFEEISDVMANGEKVQILGFGTFETRVSSERMGQNPHTGEKILIKGRTCPKFKPGNALKEKVAAGKQI